MVQFVLLSLFKLINLSYAVSCNSVSYIQNDVALATYPTNVCIAQVDPITHEASSHKFVCDSSGVARNQWFEGNLDCSGTPMTQDHYWGLPLTSSRWSVVCDSTPCEYALMELWNGVTSCNGDTAGEYNGIVFKIIMVEMKVECQKFGNRSQGHTCTNGTFTYVIYDDGITDCSGEPMHATPWSNECNVGYGTAGRYTCNLGILYATHSHYSELFIMCATWCHDLYTVAPDDVINTQTLETTTTELTTTQVTRPTTSHLPSRGYALQVPNSLTFFVFLIILCSVCIVSCF